MPAAVTLTLAEASEVLDPPMPNLGVHIHALGWKPDGYRHTGKPGHPFPAYDSVRLMELHAALVPFLRN
jgi:hypothetical protein